MASTLLLDQVEWDLLLDVDGNIAVASEPYSLAQDAASAIKTFAGEVYFDTSLGLPYMTQIFGLNPPLALLKAQFAAAAKTMPGIAQAQCFITALADRRVAGQIQVSGTARGQQSAVPFSVINPQGVG